MTNFKALSPAAPAHDYQKALQNALSWLGDRHLLAEPVNRRAESRVQTIDTHGALPAVRVVQWVQHR